MFLLSAAASASARAFSGVAQLSALLPRGPQAGAQRSAAALGVALVAPDTSPRGLNVEGAPPFLPPPLSTLLRSPTPLF